MKELGIYVHIPFCIRKCLYCDFTSFANNEDKIEKYICNLKDEIISSFDYANEPIDFENYKVTTIYFGGGTPSSIESKFIIEILNTIKSKIKNIPTEITIEVNPGTVTRQKLEDYYKNGINRISIGLQTTSNQLLKTIGRIHNYEQFLETYNMAREVGFKNINIDLMIGLPTQNLQDVENDLGKIINLKPEHISVYSLILEEGTPLEQMISKKELFVPSEIIERKMYWLVKNRLEENGYNHYEISNFATKNYNSLHNSNCWEQKEYIGYGVAAHSYLNNVRYSNSISLEEYDKNAKKKEIHEKQNNEEKMKEFMLLGLRKIEGIQISKFKEKFVENPIYVYRNELDKLVKEDLIIIDNDSIKLTNKGIDLANLVWENFI